MVLEKAKSQSCANDLVYLNKGGYVDLRGSERCGSCRMQLRLCICEIIPSIRLSTRISLIVHSREEPKPTNTGTLAVKCLPNSVTYIRGREGQPTTHTNLVPEGYQSVVLFPSPDAVVLTPEVVSSFDQPINLIVPDGNWKQAGRIPKRELAVQNVPRVILPAGSPSEYRLRREPRKPYGLATMEAIARALRIIEGETVYDELMHVFRVMVERTLYTKGKLKLEEIYGGINPLREEMVSEPTS